MKKRAYVLNVVENTLTLSADFVDAMNDPTSDEYKLLCQFKHDFPNRVVRKTHATPTHYNNSDSSKTTRQKNRGLTYESMEKFMGALPTNSEEYLEAYKELCKKAKAMCASPYSAVSAWFMKQFPEYRKNPMFYAKKENLPKIIDFSAYLADSTTEPSVDAAEGEVEKGA